MIRIDVLSRLKPARVRQSDAAILRMMIYTYCDVPQTKIFRVKAVA